MSAGRIVFQELLRGHSAVAMHISEMALKMTKPLFHVTSATALLVVGFFWSLISFRLDFQNPMVSDWFSRSGAVLVVLAFWSGLITRPVIANASASDLVNVFEASLGSAERMHEHWCSRYRIPTILLVIELIVGTVGTLIWAYGDILVEQLVVHKLTLETVVHGL